ncbi:hypothetical protein C0J52_03242 [Blattella germanica]|nr:hypothetical protein C0J52_03242 [Blattella germanica]
MWDGWYGPSGRGDGATYDMYKVMSSDAGRAVTRNGRSLTPAVIQALRIQAEVTCDTVSSVAVYSKGGRSDCKPLQAPCLFNIRSDPCEQNNLASVYPEILQLLEMSLIEINATAVPPSNLPWDPRADPRFWDHTWTNFGDYSILSNAVS